jgi:hypothetical protein
MGTGDDFCFGINGIEIIESALIILYKYNNDARVIISLPPKNTPNVMENEPIGTPEITIITHANARSLITNNEKNANI